MCNSLTANIVSDARQCGESGSMTVYSQLCVVGELMVVYSEGVDQCSDWCSEHGEYDRPEDRTLRNARAYRRRDEATAASRPELSTTG